MSEPIVLRHYAHANRVIDAEALDVQRANLRNVTKEIRLNAQEWAWLKSKAEPSETVFGAFFGIDVFVSELVPNNRAVLVQGNGSLSVVALRPSGEEDEVTEPCDHINVKEGTGGIGECQECGAEVAS